MLFVSALLITTVTFAEEGETGVLGVGDPLEVGAVGGVYSTQGAAAEGSTDLSLRESTLLGVRVHGGAYTHRTLLGNGGGVEANLSIGYALAEKGYFWGQLDALANVGLLNVGLGPVVLRLHVLVGFGFSLWSGTSLIGGGRLAIGLPKAFSLEASWMTLPSVDLTFSHRAQANLVIRPIQVALGAELNFGSMKVGESHFSVIGTASWRPKFD